MRFFTWQYRLGWGQSTKRLPTLFYKTRHCYLTSRMSQPSSLEGDKLWTTLYGKLEILLLHGAALVSRIPRSSMPACLGWCGEYPEMPSKPPRLVLIRPACIAALGMLVSCKQLPSIGRILALHKTSILVRGAASFFCKDNNHPSLYSNLAMLLEWQKQHFGKFFAPVLHSLCSSL